MSFWNLNDNSEKIESSGNFEAGGGNIEPIPENTDLLVAADQAGWHEYEGNRHIELRWQVLKPAEYAGRKVFQKIRVLDEDAKKSDKAKRMLAAIDANAGGHLIQFKSEPSDSDIMSALINKQMVIKVQVWEMDGKHGNWVCAVSPKSAGLSAAPAPAPAPKEHESMDDLPF